MVPCSEQFSKQTTISRESFFSVCCRDLYIAKNQKLCQNQNSKWRNFAMAFIQNLVSIKVHIFWEGHKTLRNLHHRFDRNYIGQIYSGDFAKNCEMWLFSLFFWNVAKSALLFKSPVTVLPIVTCFLK